MFTALLLLIAASRSSALVGYDCSGPTLNTITFSTTDPITCNAEDTEPVSEQLTIQLLELSELFSTTVMQCKIDVDRTIYYCGMHSHVPIVHNGRKQYLHNVSREACQLLHSSGAINVAPSFQINGVQLNSSSTHSITMAGRI